MKLIHSCLALGLVFPLVGSASYNGPYLSKRDVPGYTSSDLSVSTTCEIYLDKVVINKTLGNALSSQEVKEEKLTTPLTILNSLIYAASNSERNESPGPTDAGSTAYHAFSVGPNDRVIDVVLFSSGDKIVDTEGEAANTLRAFIDLICK